MQKPPQKPKTTRKAGGMDLTELKPEDFRPMPKAKFGETLRKGAPVKRGK
jgi:hypothetical protein